MREKKLVLATDYVLDVVEKTGVKHVFGVTGGAISNQIDAFSRNNKVKFIAVQHEQAAAMAAEGYARINGYGVAMATSGPGGSNMITGISGCWFDSIPTLFITGQVSTFDLKTNGVRQRGFQEIGMSDLMKPITKFSKLITDPKDLAKSLETAIKISKSDRFGPVHLDLPMDVQMSKIEEEKINLKIDRKKIKINLTDTLGLIKNAKRPVLILGNGVKLAGAVNEFKKLADKLNWPILPSWAYAEFQHKNRIELFGVYGSRGANFVVQNADLILAIGTRLDTRMTGSNPKQFAREAKKIIVDIDKNELEKKVVIPDVALNIDAKDFLSEINKNKIECGIEKDWLKKCLRWKDEYPLVTKEAIKDNVINPYNFCRILSEEAAEGDIITADTGANLAWLMQCWKFKKNQNLFSSFGNSPMGYSLPAAIGASFAANKRVICTTGDGGIQMNIQELQTIVNYDLPIKIFVFSNKGYGMIRQFQDLYMGGRHEATCEGVPDFAKVAEAYGIQSIRVEKKTQLRKAIKKALASPKAFLVDVLVEPSSIIEPRAIFGKPIEEQSPYLPEKDTLDHLLVKRWKP